MEKLIQLWQGTGIYYLEPGHLIMVALTVLLLFLAIKKNFEPLLLVPIGFGGLLANIPSAGLAASAVSQALQYGPPEVATAIQNVLGGLPYYEVPSVAQETARSIAAAAGFTDGILYLIYQIGLPTGVFPLLIFMGVGAMTDFGPLLANPKTLLLGAAAQFGIFTSLLGALALSTSGIGIDFSLKDAASIGIIGGADGPTAIFVAGRLSPELLGAIAVAAYSYMALVPLIQPPIIRALTTHKERAIKMEQLRHVSQLEKIMFPLVLLGLVSALLPDAVPLLGMFCFGNLMRECGVVDRLSETAQHALINIVTILLGLAVGSKLQASSFLQLETLGILVLGMVAFCIGTAAGVLMGKLMNLFSKEAINPIIGAAGVSAGPMAARVANKVGQEANPRNFLIMHAMGPNVAGVIGSAVAAGILLHFAG